MAPDQDQIDECFNLLTRPCTNPTRREKYRAFKMTGEGDVDDYLGVKMQELPNGTIKLSQPHLIDQIIKDVGFNDRTKTQPTLASQSAKLNRDIHGFPFTEEWNYHSVIGKLNFLEKPSRPDMSYAVHQAARFSSCPKQSHAMAVKCIVKCLELTRTKGIIRNPQRRSFDCWVDADFIGNWDSVNADVDPSTAKSRTGFVIMCGGCPLLWASKLQREVALSMTEAEYNALSESLRTVIHLMALSTKSAKIGGTVATATPVVHCKVMEDNSGAIEWSRLPKMRPRTKHLCVRLHHFREHVRRGLITVNRVPTSYQLADIATKAQPRPLFESQADSIMQWSSENMTKEQLKIPAEHLRACEIIDRLPLLLEQEELARSSMNEHARQNLDGT